MHCCICKNRIYVKGDIFMNEEAIKFIELFRKLDFERTKEFYYMVKGAVIVSQDQKRA